jgi:hypothetical protein
VNPLVGVSCWLLTSQIPQGFQGPQPLGYVFVSRLCVKGQAGNARGDAHATITIPLQFGHISDVESGPLKVQEDVLASRIRVKGKVG